MHQHAIDHLRERDPRLARIIDRIGACELAPRAGGSHFDALVRAIIYQQLSGKAAATIHGRVEALYGDRAPTPEEILGTDDERLRAAGLSRQKISYVKDLAARVVSGELATDALHTMPDDAVIASLVRVKGIGRWSAQMFLMFRLGRPNVLPDLDLGVQKGIQHAYRLPRLPTPKDVLRIGERWAPYASVASWYMWRLLELPDVIGRQAKARSDARANKAGSPATRRAVAAATNGSTTGRGGPTRPGDAPPRSRSTTKTKPANAPPRSRSTTKRTPANAPTRSRSTSKAKRASGKTVTRKHAVATKATVARTKAKTGSSGRTFRAGVAKTTTARGPAGVRAEGRAPRR